MADEQGPLPGHDRPMDENIFVEGAPNGAQEDATHVRDGDAAQETVTRPDTRDAWSTRGVLDVRRVPTARGLSIEALVD